MSGRFESFSSAEGILELIVWSWCRLEEWEWDTCPGMIKAVKEWIYTSNARTDSFCRLFLIAKRICRLMQNIKKTKKKKKSPPPRGKTQLTFQSKRIHYLHCNASELTIHRVQFGIGLSPAGIIHNVFIWGQGSDSQEVFRGPRGFLE